MTEPCECRAPSTGLAALMLMAALGGCASSQVSLVGRPRTALSSDQVRIYLEPPASHYEEIANLTASSSGSFEITAAGKMDKVVERLKRQAARLGANGILLHGVGDQAGGSVVAGAGTEWDTGRSPYGLRLSISAVFRQKAGDGVAIYVTGD